MWPAIGYEFETTGYWNLHIIRGRTSVEKKEEEEKVDGNDDDLEKNKENY